MKTRNSIFQKTGLETLTVLAILFASCFTINAQGNNYYDNTALAIIESSTDKTSLTGFGTGATEFAYFAEILTEEGEEELKVENWMVESLYFEEAEMGNDAKDVLMPENRMTAGNLFIATETNVNENNTPVVQKVNKPKTIGVTFHGAQFGRRAFILVEMEDPTLELENWMVDQRIWNSKKYVKK